MLTLRLRLLMLWLFTLALCIALGVILYSVYELGTEAQTGRTVSLASNACTALQTRYPRSLQPANNAVDPVLMTAVLNATLDDAPGVEGGFWHAGSGFVAYAFPTHQGSTPKRDVPTTARDRIEALVRTTLARAEPAVDLLHGSRETVVLTACPIDASGTVLGAWTMARVPLAVGKAYDALTRGLALLLLFVVGSGLWLSYSFFRWTRHFTRIENALSGAGPAGSTEIQRAGDAELDRVVVAVNQFSTRLAAAQREADALNTSLERAERFAALGRMAASVAHEVRNPIAAIRLRAENALARPDKREANLTSCCARWSGSRRSSGSFFPGPSRYGYKHAMSPCATGSPNAWACSASAARPRQSSSTGTLRSSTGGSIRSRSRAHSTTC